MRVKVYFNLHKLKWSVVAMEGPEAGIVIAHADSVILGDVDFKVSEAGRQRVIKEKRKNVHAYATGYLINLSGSRTKRGCKVLSFDWFYRTTSDKNIINRLKTADRRISYNPYRFNKFFEVATETLVDDVNMVYMEQRNVWASSRRTATDIN